MKILYVDDEIARAVLTQRTLEDNFHQGFELLHAETISSALNLLDTTSDIDLVLADLRLPDGTGLDLLGKVNLRNHPPAVVLVTGEGDQEAAVAALKAGAADYLVRQSDYLYRLPVVVSNAVAQNQFLRGQAALREAEVRYQSLVERMPAVVFLDTIDEIETTLYISPRVEELTGYTSEEWQADPDIWVKRLHLDDRERIMEAEERTHKKGQRFQEEYRFIRRDGRVVWIKEDTSPVCDRDGNQLYWQGILIDVTQEKESEVALQRQVVELAVLQAATVAGAESYSEDEIIEKVTRILGSIYQEVCGILLLDETGKILTPHPSYLGADVSNWRDGYPITDGITGKSASLGKILRVGDVTKEEGYIKIASGVMSELCAPIRVNERVIGVINVESSNLDAFTTNDEGLLTAIASGLGNALERLRLFKKEEQRAKELDTLYQTTKSLAQSLEPETIAEKLISIMSELLGYEFASVFLLDDQTRLLIPLAVSQSQSLNIHEKDMEFLRNERKPLGDGIIGWVAEHGEAIRSGDVSKEPRYLPAIKGIKSELCVPLIARGVTIGAINIETTKLNAYTGRDEGLLTGLANSAAIAFENARLYEAEFSRRQQAEALREATNAVTLSIETESLFEIILDALPSLVPHDSASIEIINQDTVEIVAERGLPENFQFIGKRYRWEPEKWKSMGDTREPIIIPDIAQDERFVKLEGAEYIRSWMGIPMIVQGRFIGFVNLDSRTLGFFTNEHASIAQTFCNQAAIAIEKARLYNETQRRVRELETINRLSSSLQTTNSQSVMLDIFLGETLNLLGEENGSVWLYDPSSKMLVQRAASGVAKNVKFKELVPTDGIIAHVFQSGKVYSSANLRDDPLIFKPNLDVILPGYGGVCIPIKSTAGILGAIFIQMMPNRQITEQTSLLTTLAGIIGNSIHRVELLEQSQEQVHRLTTLRDIDSAIASSTDLNVTLNILTDHTLKHLKVDAVDIMLYHPELQSLTYLCSAGYKTLSPSRPLMRLGEGLAGQVVMKGRTYHLIDLQNSSEVKRDPLLAREGFATYLGVPLIVKGQIKGVFEIFHRSPLSPNAEWMQFLHTLAGEAAIAIDNSQLFNNLQRSNQELTQAYDTTLEGWARALELRDRETEGHTRRVTDLTMRLARYMGIAEEQLVNIYRGVLLHDIGKMGVPDHILKKTGNLTEAEWTEMRQHPQYAFDLLAPITYLRPVLDIPYCHHEHWDGSGYPRGLKGEQIPLSARIFSIVDIWDALLSDRPYRKAWPRKKVIEYIKSISGVHLDPKVVDVFLKMISEDESNIINSEFNLDADKR